MIKKITLGIVFIFLTGGLLFQYSFIKYQEKRFAEIGKENGHARTIHALQNLLEQIDQNGIEYSRRAVFIARSYEMVQLEKWESEKGIELTESAKDLLLRVEKYDKENKISAM